MARAFANTKPLEGKKSISAQDADYMAAVERGDMETARQMVEQRAAEMGFADAVPKQTLIQDELY